MQLFVANLLIVRLKFTPSRYLLIRKKVKLKWNCDFFFKTFVKVELFGRYHDDSTLPLSLIKYLFNVIFNSRRSFALFF